MKKIRSSKKGFTLAELLIVVAIIGVLVGISIPIFTTQLEKSRESTDIANLRAAKAAVTAAYLDDGFASFNGGTATDSITLYYDADAGKLATGAPSVKYGKGTATLGTNDATYEYLGYKYNTVASGKAIKIVVAPDASTGELTFTYSWE